MPLNPNLLLCGRSGIIPEPEVQRHLTQVNQPLQPAPPPPVPMAEQQNYTRHASQNAAARLRLQWQSNEIPATHHDVTANQTLTWDNPIVPGQMSARQAVEVTIGVNRIISKADLRQRHHVDKVKYAVLKGDGTGNLETFTVGIKYTEEQAATLCLAANAARNADSYVARNDRPVEIRNAGYARLLQYFNDGCSIRDAQEIPR